MAANGDIYRVAARMVGPDGQDIINVWHIRLSTYVAGDDQDVADEVVFRISTNYQLLEPAITEDQTSVDMSIQNLTTNAVLGSFAWGPAFQGNGTGDNAPPQASPFSYFRTGIARRVGRKFWGIITEALSAEGYTQGAASTALITFIAAWLSGFTGGTTGNFYEFGVYNENKSPAFAPFTEAVHRGRLMTQRRRRPEVGS